MKHGLKLLQIKQIYLNSIEYENVDAYFLVG